MSELDLLDTGVGDKVAVKRRSITALVFIFLHFLCLVVAYIFSLEEVESVIFTGGIYGVIALVMIVLALVLGRYHLLFPALFGLGIIAAVFLFIFLGELSPSRAQGPVPVLILYLMFAYLVPFAVSLWREFRLPLRKTD